MPGRVLGGAYGECFVAERAFRLDHVHGGEPLADFLSLAHRAIACFARNPNLPPLNPRDVLFLDTETTGLSGGMGTYVFMVGAGFFAEDRFVVRQFFMRHHAEEAAMLAAINELVDRFRAVVTFNGKAFDIPLLETRFVASRQRSGLRADPHLDLLFLARRMWRERLSSCSLESIEHAIFRHSRQVDVPSWVIPQLYFSYVRGGDARRMVRVFHHNLHDVLSLVALACRLGRLTGDPTTTTDGEDLYAVGRLYEDLGYADDASGCYERALHACRSSALRVRIVQRLARLCRRAGRQARAAELWQDLLWSGHPGLLPHVELAKHYEHGARDYGRAVAVVEQALTLVQLAEMRQRPGAALERAELERRLARVLAKRSRISA